MKPVPLGGGKETGTFLTIEAEEDTEEISNLDNLLNGDLRMEEAEEDPDLMAIVSVAVILGTKLANAMQELKMAVLIKMEIKIMAMPLHFAKQHLSITLQMMLK